MRYGALYIYTIFVFLYFMAQMCVRADSRDIAPIGRLFKSFDLGYVIFYSRDKRKGKLSLSSVLIFNCIEFGTIKIYCYALLSISGQQ